MSRPTSPRSDYDRTGDFYFNLLKKLLSSPDFFFHENVAIMRHMLGDIPGLQVCDLACGEGFLSRALAARGAHVTGIHRMLSTYLNALIQARFTITELREPLLDLPNPTTLDQQLRTIAPRVLIVAAQRR